MRHVASESTIATHEALIPKGFKILTLSTLEPPEETQVLLRQLPSAP